MPTRPFPAGFLWGVATAGHQNEGDNTNSDTWFLEHVTPSIFRTPSGKACNSWELWRDDLDLVKGMGLTSFRFSIEWARVEPIPPSLCLLITGRFWDTTTEQRWIPHPATPDHTPHHPHNQRQQP